MRIKKLYQGTMPDHKVLNQLSDSQTNTYSCHALNSIVDSSIPMDAIIDYDGDEIPEGFELVENSGESGSGYEPNLISLSIVAKPSFSANVYYKIPFDTCTKFGDKLSFVDGGVKIGPGVSCIKVSAIANPQSSVSGMAYLRIGKNSSDNVITWNMCNITSSWGITTVPIPLKIADVKEGDMIYAYVYTAGSGSVGLGNGADCSLTVEVVK